MIHLNKIYNEDCLQGMKKIQNNSIDAIICDLPYGTTACSWDTIIPFDKLWKEYERVIKRNGPIILFGAEPFSTQLRMSNFQHYKYDWYWMKNNVTGFTFAKRQPMRSVETISVFSIDGKANYFPQDLVPLKEEKYRKRQTQFETIYKDSDLSNKAYMQEFTGYPNNVLKFEKESKYTFHPTQKPVALLEYLIKTYTLPGQLVLDNCMGSGTTAIAAINTDRKFIGFETDKQYYEKAIARIKENSTQLSLF